MLGIETEEYGNALRYRYAEEYGRFDFMIDYLPKIDEVIVLFPYRKCSMFEMQSMWRRIFSFFSRREN